MQDKARHVRVIEYEVPDRDGDGKGELIALVTTITEMTAGPGAAAGAGLPRALGATRSRLERVELAEGGPIHVGDIVPGPVCKDRPRPGVRCG